MDAVNPAAPVQDCVLAPAAGGRFVSSTLIAFWLGSSLFTADIGSGAITLASNLPVAPSQGAFSPDGSRFAYRVGDDTSGLSDHLFVAGRDLTLITRPGIGGHGGPPYGPYDELAFSGDAQYLLTDDSFGANFASGPPNFVVYDMSGKTVFQSGTAAFGEWAPHGDKLYFLAESQPHNIAGDLHSWDPVAGDVPVARGFSSYFWPAVAPDGQRILFNSYDSAGAPHLWAVDLASGHVAQIGKAISSHPVFVGATAVWSNEELPCSNCMGQSQTDGKLVAADVSSGSETAVNLGAFSSADGANTYWVQDVWIG